MSPSTPFIHLHNPESSLRFENGYLKLCSHFKWALTEVFDHSLFQKHGFSNLPNPQRVIILEEDLMIAPDFFEYFASLVRILDSDSSLLGN